MSEQTQLRRRLVRAALKARDSYGLLFCLLILDLLAASLATSRGFLLPLMILVAGTLVLALRTSEVGPRGIRAALLAGGACVVFGVLAGVEQDPVWAGWMFAAMAALLLVTPVTIGKRLMGHRQVTAQTLFGAVSIYVIFGLMFAFTYMAINFISGNPFYAQGQTRDPVNFIYASYITLTTVGYGDFTPAQSLGKMLVAIEALIGQVFLVTAVARLVSVYSFNEETRRSRLGELIQAEKAAQRSASGTTASVGTVADADANPREGSGAAAEDSELS